jgi:hypothetical protein
MATDTTLIEKRKELKHRLTVGEYKTLVDGLLADSNRALQKITRRTKPVPTWLITIILSLISTILGIASLYMAGESPTTNNVFEQLGLGYGPGVVWAFSINLLLFTDLVVINQYLARLFNLWREKVLDATQSIVSLNEFESWLNNVSNRRLNLIATMIGGVALSLIMVAAVALQDISIGYGPIFGLALISMLISSILYLFWMVILLSERLRRYDLNLFAADPGNSELISRLSTELGLFVFLVAISGAIGALIAASAGKLFPILGVAQALIVWLPLIATFILNQTSLSSIIRRVKWQTLNDIQTKVERIQAAKNFGNKGTLEAVKRLMEFHDRVIATRNSALDFRTVLSFINSMLLPLLAFLLSNLDIVADLFR